jgi:hypothetical protein
MMNNPLPVPGKKKTPFFYYEKWAKKTDDIKDFPSYI